MIHWRLDGASLPHFTLVPANTYLIRIGCTRTDLDFPEDSALSKAYVFGGQGQAAIRALFTAERRAALAAAPSQHVAAGRHDLFRWREARLPRSDRFDAVLNEADRILRLLRDGSLPKPGP